MAQFLKGKFKAFYKVGSSECVRDTIRFRQFKDTQINFEYVLSISSYLILIGSPEEIWRPIGAASGDMRMLR